MFMHEREAYTKAMNLNKPMAWDSEAIEPEVITRSKRRTTLVFGVWSGLDTLLEGFWRFYWRKRADIGVLRMDRLSLA